ncbi:MAG: hypothetical protein KAJ46_06065 [Sedimentisphaerales bacterium]|nr:hypothetical protein [Sedimentisphaerales bacterium]
MSAFEIVAGVASILSLIISIVVVSKVISIKNVITMKTSTNTNVRQAAKGSNNTQIGGDKNA